MSDAIKEILNNEKRLREIVEVSFDNIINTDLLKISDTIKEILNKEKKLREILKVSFDNVITDRSSQIDQD